MVQCMYIQGIQFKSYLNYESDLQRKHTGKLIFWGFFAVPGNLCHIGLMKQDIGPFH